MRLARFFGMTWDGIFCSSCEIKWQKGQARSYTAITERDSRQCQTPVPGNGGRESLSTSERLLNKSETGWCPSLALANTVWHLLKRAQLFVSCTVLAVAGPGGCIPALLHTARGVHCRQSNLTPRNMVLRPWPKYIIQHTTHAERPYKGHFCNNHNNDSIVHLHDGEGCYASKSHFSNKRRN